MALLSAQGAVYYVKKDAAGTGTGASWADALPELQSALQKAKGTDQIWIAAGTYYPDYDVKTGVHTGDRDLRFVLKDGVSLFGGFAGHETAREQRNWVANPVILSGDIGVRGEFSDNTRTIMQRNGATRNAVIEGVVFMLGNANIGTELGNQDVAGTGGAFWSDSSQEFRFCVFLGNYAIYSGAVYNRHGFTKMINCLFYDNEAQYVSGAFETGSWGGGAEILNCTIIGNRASIYNSRGAAFVCNTNTVLRNNLAWGNTGEPRSDIIELRGETTLQNNWFQPEILGYKEGIEQVNPDFISLPSKGPDGQWGTADDDLYGGGLTSVSPVIDTAAPTSLPADSTDLDGDGDVTESVPYDLLRRPRTLRSAADAGALELMNLAPSSVSLSPAALLENEGDGTLIGSFTSVDVNGGPFIYTLVPGEGDADNALVTIQGSSLHSAAEYDFETKPELSIRVRSTDSLNESLETIFKIQVIDRVEQTLNLEAVSPVAWKAPGGMIQTGEAPFPLHWGLVRLTRTGDTGAPLSVRFETGGTAVPEEHYLLNIPNSGPGSVRTLHLDAGETEEWIMVQPLFDGAARGHEVIRGVSLTLLHGGESYDTGPNGAVSVAIYPSASAAWRAKNPEAPQGPASLLAQLLGTDPEEEDSGIQLPVRSGAVPGAGACLILSARLHPAAADVRPVFETSADLLSWQPAAPRTELLGVGGAGETDFCFSLADASRCFVRMSAVLSDRPADRATGGPEPIALKGIPAGRLMIKNPLHPGVTPARNVQITAPFYMSRTEITQAQYEAVTGISPSSRQGPDLPVESLTWEEASAFCRLLTEREAAASRLPEGMLYRLPTEAEWEYAAGAGSEEESPAGPGQQLTDFAWFSENSFGVIHGTGLKAPNGWGLHDMHGNVSEWCLDWEAPRAEGIVFDPAGPDRGLLRAVRGGHALMGAEYQVKGRRGSAEPTTRAPLLGLRIVLAQPAYPSPGVPDIRKSITPAE